HGTGYGALNATHRAHFREPFRRQLAEFATFVPFPEAKNDLPALEKQLTAILRKKKTGAILVEPVQGRAGIRVPPPAFLRLLRRLCDRHGTLLIADEIYTGFGRTGLWFACEHSGVTPDLICLGKALTGGFPLSACVGRADLMDAAWPASTGEAIHTSTFLGHPVGCAMALAQIAELRHLRLPERSARLGKRLIENLRHLTKLDLPLHIGVRGLGLMVGVEVRLADGSPATDLVLAAVKRMLRYHTIFLPEGPHSNVISLTPPLTISEDQLRTAAMAIAFALAALTEPQ
ncbi:MAG TPA: aminotransferase class III-fold pyridoxal phosphate-dependent enzyme, partial [Verrucomicrobiae bacterium]